MPNDKTGNAASASRALEPAETNPLDFVPDKIPFDIPYGPPISLGPSSGSHRRCRDRSEEAQMEDERSGGRFRRQPRRLSTDGRRDACTLFRLPSTRHAQRQPSGAQPRYSKTVSSLCI